MLKHWKWLGAGLMALVVLGLASTMRTSEAKPKPKPDPEPDPQPFTFSPEPGVLLTWVEPGSSDRAFASFLDADGRIVVAGYTSPGSDGSQDFAVLRYQADGILDPTFGNGGAVTTPYVKGFSDVALAAVAYPDDRILLAGNAAAGDFALARFNSDGNPDKEFGGKGKNAGKVQTDLGGNDRLHGVTVQPDGRIVAAGSTNASGAFGFALARYTSAGKLDPTFGGTGIVETQISQGWDEANAVVMHPAGILAVGVANDATGTHFALVRYLQNGDLDPSFGVGGIVISDFTPGGDQADAAAIDADGRILVVGNVQVPSDPGTGIYDWAVARYLPNGMLDEDFGADEPVPGLVLTDVTGYERAHAVAIQPEDGKIVSAGFAQVPGTTNYAFAVVRHNENGTLDTGFGDQGTVVTPISIFADDITDSAEVESVVIQPDGGIVVTGWASRWDPFGSSIRCIAMARYNPDGTLDGTFGVEEP